MGISISKRNQNSPSKILIFGSGYNGKTTFIKQSKQLYHDTVTVATSTDDDDQSSDYQESMSHSEVSRVELGASHGLKFINIDEEHSLQSLSKFKKSKDVGVIVFFFGLNEYDHPIEEPDSSETVRIFNDSSKMNPSFNDIQNSIGNNSSSRSSSSNNNKNSNSKIKYRIVNNNRMRENIENFKKIVNCNCFKSTSIIVLLNKKELFEEKLKSIPFVNHFPEYEGPNDIGETGAFIAHQFNKADKYSSKKRLSIHTFDPNDSEQIKDFFQFIKKKIENDNSDNNVIN